MKNILVLTLLISLLFSAPLSRAFAKQAQQPLSPAAFGAHLKGAETSKLNLKAFQDLQKKGPVAVVDVRSKESYAQQHLKGAISLPLTEMTAETLAETLPDKTAPVVLVCDNSFAPTRMVALSLQAFPLLKAHGYENVWQLSLWDNKDGAMAAPGELQFEKTGN